MGYPGDQSPPPSMSIAPPLRRLPKLQSEVSTITGTERMRVRLNYPRIGSDQPHSSSCNGPALKKIRALKERLARFKKLKQGEQVGEKQEQVGENHVGQNQVVQKQVDCQIEQGGPLCLDSCC